MSGPQVLVRIPFPSHQWWRGGWAVDRRFPSVQPAIHPYTRLAIRCYGKTRMNFLANTIHPSLFPSTYPSIHPSIHHPSTLRWVLC